MAVIYFALYTVVFLLSIQENVYLKKIKKIVAILIIL